jgi:prepilin-type N-terminal cleavage/methylation domain-containing protein
MRKGFTLVEVLIVVIVLPFMMLVLDDFFRTLIKDIPRSYQVVQENASLLSMLEQMQKDIDRAKGLPESFDEYISGDKLLLIELAEGMICYQLKDKKVLRRKLTDNQQSPPAAGIIQNPALLSALGQTVWSVPNAKVEWQVWRKDGDGYAVEVKTHIEHKIRGDHWEKKMANSHLYFVGAF